MQWKPGRRKDTIKIAVYSKFCGFDPYGQRHGPDKRGSVQQYISDCSLRYYDGKYEMYCARITASARTAQSIPFSLKEGALSSQWETLTAGDGGIFHDALNPADVHHKEYRQGGSRG